MKASRRTHHSDKVSMWLLTVTLVLGLFAFSGYAGNTPSQEKEVPKTEKVISITANAKRPASYTKAFAQFHLSTRFAFRQSEFDLLACFHNRLTKTRIDQNSKQVSSVQKPARFFQHKTLPQDPDEDLFNSSRG